MYYILLCTYESIVFILNSFAHHSLIGSQLTPTLTVSGFGFGSTPGLSDASRILAQINFNQSGAKGASLNYFKGIEVKGGTIINPRIVREGKNKFLVSIIIKISP